MGSCEMYSLGEFLIRPTSVVALEGARNRESSSSSGSSVPPRRLRSNKEVRRPAIEDCVGVPASEGAYRGLGNVLVARRLLLRCSSRLRALGLALTLTRSVLIACCGVLSCSTLARTSNSRFEGLAEL
jgi:hypothetical protein